MSVKSNLYHRISLPAVAIKTIDIAPKMYKGFSTVNTTTQNFSLFDIELVKQDLINHFYIRQGERLMQPEFGTIIWDVLFEPMTEQIKELILQDVNKIINYDPRIYASEVVVTAYETGIQIECSLQFNPYNISQSMKLRFDQTSGLLIQ